MNNSSLRKFRTRYFKVELHFEKKQRLYFCFNLLKKKKCIISLCFYIFIATVIIATPLFIRKGNQDNTIYELFPDKG